MDVVTQNLINTSTALLTVLTEMIQNEFWLLLMIFILLCFSNWRFYGLMMIALRLINGQGSWHHVVLIVAMILIFDYWPKVKYNKKMMELYYEKQAKASYRIDPDFPNGGKPPKSK